MLDLDGNKIFGFLMRKLILYDYVSSSRSQSKVGLQLLHGLNELNP